MGKQRGGQIQELSAAEILKQQHEWDCGPTALRFIAALYGISISAEQAQRDCRATPGEGCSHQQLIEALVKLGLSVKELIGDITQLPQIVNCQIVENGKAVDGHYFVVISVFDFRMTFYDPEDGTIKQMSLDDFDHIWKAFRYPPDRWGIVPLPRKLGEE